MSTSTADLVHKCIGGLYEVTKTRTGGSVADYIPELAGCNPELYGISFCDIRGKQTSIGDVTDGFCLQSCVKPLTYCLAREAHRVDPDKFVPVHDHVGFEPSGRSFNEFALNHDGIPHNPLINSGAIMVASLIHPDDEPSTRFNKVHKFMNELSGGPGNIAFNNGVYLSERHHADRNQALAYYMRENGAYSDPQPTPSQLSGHLDLYFQCCALSANCNTASVLAATLANRGTCPLTNKKVIDPKIVMDALAIMHTCGMYDYSGQFAFEIGLPAKSGVSGCVLLVIPDVGGMCIYSPKLGRLGNSVRALEFCAEFSKVTSHRFHMYGSIKQHKMITVAEESKQVEVQRLIAAAASGDVELIASVCDLSLFREADYDGRTALHLACAEGRLSAAKMLIEKGAISNAEDRTGKTPLQEANGLEDKELVAQFEELLTEATELETYIN